MDKTPQGLVEKPRWNIWSYNFYSTDYHSSHVFLCLFILLYVGHQALGVYSGSDWIVEVQLVVEGAFSQHRAGYPFTEEEEGTESHYSNYY